MRTGLVMLAAGITLTHQTFGAENIAIQSVLSDWPVEIRKEHRPGTYWWCPGSAFDRENIDRNLERMQEAGIGNVHLVPIYGARGYEDRHIDFLSFEWIEMLHYIVQKCQRLGMNLDMTTGTGWCFGGPGLDRRMSDGVASYDKNNKTLSLNPGKRVKRAAPGGEGNMLNPYSSASMRFYLKRFSRAFESRKPNLPRAQYHDSFEYNGDWCSDLLEKFKALLGYDLAEHLDMFFDDGDSSETRARIKCDYRTTAVRNAIPGLPRPQASVRSQNHDPQ